MEVGMDNLKWDDQGLIPAIVQDAVSGRVLMLAYMNREALQRSLESGETWFFSRSRGALMAQRGAVRACAKDRGDTD